MADQSNASIRPPKDWQDFERKARVLFVHHLNDPLTTNNGRSGQAQHGVDIYGCRGGNPTHIVGVQCIPIIAAETSFELTSESLGIKDNVSPTFLDPILAAKESNKLLLCEDMVYRQFAASAAQLNSVWLQPILMVARDARIITQERYSEAIYKLALTAHTVLSIDTNVLLFGMKSTDYWEASFRQLSKALFGKDADLESHILVMANFIKQIWKGADSSSKIKQAVGCMFERYFFGEWNSAAYGYDTQAKVKRLSPQYPRKINMTPVGSGIGCDGGCGGQI